MPTVSDVVRLIAVLLPNGILKRPFLYKRNLLFLLHYFSIRELQHAASSF